MNSKTGHQIKQRNTANDVFITPKALSKKAIEIAQEGVGGMGGINIWYDPFRNSGSYYNQFPEPDKYENKWSEILDGRDFFKFTENNWGDMYNGFQGESSCRIICSNPPDSILDDVIKHTIAIKPDVVNYLIGINNLTPRRIEMFEKAGYIQTNFHLCKVFKWYGMSCIVQFERDSHDIPCLTYDRIVWREDEMPENDPNLEEALTQEALAYFENEDSYVD